MLNVGKKVFMKNALFSNRSIVAPISFGIGLFLLLTILVNPLIVHAESYDNTLPYYFNSVDDFNSWLNQSIIDSIDSYGLPVYDPNYVLIPVDYEPYGYEGNYIIYRGWFYLTPISSFVDSSNNSDWYNHSLSYNLSNETSYYFGVHYDIFGGFTPIVFNVSTASSPLGTLFGYSPRTITRMDNSEVTFTAYAPAYFNNDISDISGNIVLYFDGSSSDPTYVTGHAVPPDPTTSFLGNNADFGASISSSTFPNVPTISHYNPNTYNPPSVDNTNLESLVESLIDIIQYNLTYIVNSIQGFVTSIITTIQEYGKYVGSIIAYVGKVIITNIQYAIQNLYENLVSLFQPILNFISEVLTGIKTIVDEIISLGTDENGNFSLTTLFVNLAIPDFDDLQDLIEDSDTFNVISVFTTISGKVQTEFATLQGLTSQKIIHVPSCIYHGQEIGDYDIDFSWYDRYKTLGDGIISAFLIWNYIWFLFFRFPYWLRGNSSDFNGMISKGSD